MFEEYILSSVLKSICAKHKKPLGNLSWEIGPMVCEVRYANKGHLIRYHEHSDPFRAVTEALEQMLWEPSKLKKLSQSPGFRNRRAPIKRYFT